MLQMLIKPLLGVAGDMVKGLIETKKAKSEAKLTEIKAATKLKQDAIAGKVKWETTRDDKVRNKTDASKEWIVRDWAGIHKGKYPDIANYD